MITFAPATRYFIRDTPHTRAVCRWAIGLEYRFIPNDSDGIGGAMVDAMGAQICRYVDVSAEDLEER